MYRYCLRVLAVATLIVAAHCAVLLLLRAPIAAEYWVRETLILKRHQASQVPSPKLLLLGGSSTLFGFDSAQLSRAIGRPVYNFGLHASMRLEWILEEGRNAAHRGDIILLVLEPPFYECANIRWGRWQFTNAFAWGRDYLRALPPWDQVHAALTGGSLGLSFEILRAAAGSPASLLERRRAALAAPDVVLGRYATPSQGNVFAYAPDNLTSLGDIRNTTGSHFTGPVVDTLVPKSVCPQVGAALKGFTNAMRDRDVRVVFDYAPYLVETPSLDWQIAERSFSAEMTRYGLDLLGARDRLFFSRRLFFDTDLHLNEEGRRLRTARIIESLTAQGLATN